MLFAPENEICRTSIIKIYEYENRELCGTLENSCLPQKIYFRSSMQMIFMLEELYDELNFPQATTETRSFVSIQTNYLLTKQKVQQLRDQAAAARAQEKQAVLEQTGMEEGIPLATFILSLQYRANSSWQGNISWKKMNYTVQFRSLLELLHLLDEALLLVQSSGGSVEFGRMLKGYADASKQEAE